MSSDAHYRRWGAAAKRCGASSLYDLVESAALGLDGSVMLIDVALRVVAFACGETVDDLSRETVLARRAPKALGDELVPVGSRRNVTHANWIDVVGVGRRLAAPVQVGDVVAGYVVLAPGRDTPDGAPRMLGEVAAAATAWFVEEAAGHDDEDMVRAELLRGVLIGTGSLEALTGRLDRCAHRRWCLVGLGRHGFEAAAPASVPGRPRSAASPAPVRTGGATPAVERLLARCARMLEPDAATAVVDTVVCVFVPHSPGAGPVAFAERLRKRAATLAGGPLVACVGQPFDTGDDVRAEYGALRQAVAVLAARPSPGTAERAGLREHVVIAELAGLAAERPGLLSGALDVLRQDESPRSAEYLDTLLSWFDAGRDVSRAAAALRVHRNTFRYRLQRIEKLCAVDLDDPIQRFTVELQVRLLVLRGGW